MATGAIRIAESQEELTFETAAAHATDKVPIVEPDHLAGAICGWLSGHRYDCASHIVVCRQGRFLGLATIERILAAPAETPVECLMDAEAPVVGPGVDQEIAAWRAVHHGESALAVVDEAGHFVGVIPPHRLVAVLLSEHEEDLTRIGGFLNRSSSTRASSEEPVRRRLWHRLPWLFLGLSGALAAAGIVESFEESLRLNVMLAFFIPGIVYLADAVGTQTETVVVRSLSLDIPMRSMARRETLSGVAIAGVLASVAGPLVWWRWSDAALGLAVGVSVFAAASTSTIVAMGLPWVFNRFGLDPAYASGPLTTVIQDLISIWTYLTVAIAVMS